MICPKRFFIRHLECLLYLKKPGEFSLQFLTSELHEEIFSTLCRDWSQVIGDIICIWFGSVEVFETMVREQVLEAFEEKLGRCMIPYATLSVVWKAFEIEVEFFYNGFSLSFHQHRRLASIPESFPRTSLKSFWTTTSPREVFFPWHPLVSGTTGCRFDSAVLVHHW